MCIIQESESHQNAVFTCQYKKSHSFSIRCCPFDQCNRFSEKRFHGKESDRLHCAGFRSRPRYLSHRTLRIDMHILPYGPAIVDYIPDSRPGFHLPNIASVGKRWLNSLKLCLPRGTTKGITKKRHNKELIHSPSYHISVCDYMGIQCSRSFKEASLCISAACVSPS